MGQLGISVGMAVYDADGKRLGKVSRCDPWAFEVRRGLFSPYQWVVRYDEILELGADSVKIARSDADLFELAAGGLPHAWATVKPIDGDEALPATPGERGVALGQPVARSAEPAERPASTSEAAYDVEHPA
jgi:hypothetical protein